MKRIHHLFIILLSIIIISGCSHQPVPVKKPVTALRDYNDSLINYYRAYSELMDSMGNPNLVKTSFIFKDKPDSFLIQYLKNLIDNERSREKSFRYFLHITQEPDFYTQPDTMEQKYRLIISKSQFNKIIGTIMVTITEEHFKAHYIKVKEWLSKDSLIKKTGKIFITDQQWQTFMSYINGMYFWYLSSGRGGYQTDNSNTYSLEGYEFIYEFKSTFGKHNRYHMVYNDFPNDGSFKQGCQYLLNLAGINESILKDKY